MAKDMQSDEKPDYTREVVTRLRTISSLVSEHHEEQFGMVSWERLAVKLGEEVGELQGAIIRDTERRDGVAWKNKMFAELEDVLTVLHVMAARMGEELSGVSDGAGKYFLSREFKNIQKCDERLPNTAAYNSLLDACKITARLPEENFAGCDVGRAIRAARAAITKSNEVVTQ